MSKTRLVKFDDFLAHLRDNKIVKAYLSVETQQVPVQMQPELDAQGNPMPPQAAADVTSLLVMTAKTDDDKKHFTFVQLLQKAVVSNKAEGDKFNEAVKKGYAAAIDDFQRVYPSCQLYEGVVE